MIWLASILLWGERGSYPLSENIRFYGLMPTTKLFLGVIRRDKEEK